MNRWDEEVAQEYMAWYETDHAAFAVARQHRAVDRLLADWSRPGHKLLDVGCGPGVFLEVFWEAGFEVCGLDSSPAMLHIARNRLEKQTCYYTGNAECLPFDDDEFDYVSLMNVLEFCEDPALALKEAGRVARSGLIISFINHIFGRLCRRTSQTRSAFWNLPEAFTQHMHCYSWRAMRLLIQSCLSQGELTGLSILPGPPATWKNSFFWGQVNRAIYPLPVGRYGLLRVDFAPQKPLTPLYTFRVRPAAG